MEDRLTCGELALIEYAINLVLYADEYDAGGSIILSDYDKKELPKVLERVRKM